MSETGKNSTPPQDFDSKSFPQNTSKKSRVTSIRDVTQKNPTKSKLKEKMMNLHKDSEVYKYNPSMGMTTLEQADKYKKLQDEYLSKQSDKKGGKTKKTKKTNKRKNNKNKKSNRKRGSKRNGSSKRSRK
jgi:hypothetical protein